MRGRMWAMLGVLVSTVGRAGEPPRGLDALRGDVGVIAHRGASGTAPENTMAAFHRAAELGVGFELDVTLCASGEVVVIHDDTVDRTSDGTGVVAEMTLEELRTLDFGAWFSPEYAGEPIPTLREVLETFGGRVVIDIELKTTEARQALAEAVVHEIRRLGLVDHVFVTSFDPFLLGAVREADPSILRGQITATFDGAGLGLVKTLALRHMWLNGSSRPDMVAVQHVRADAAFMRRMARRGLPVLVWTVNEPAEARELRDRGVVSVISDYPAEIIESGQSSTGD